MVEQVNHVEAERRGLAADSGEVARQPGVDLHVGRHGTRVGEAAAQARAVDRVDVVARAPEQV